MNKAAKLLIIFGFLLTTLLCSLFSVYGFNTDFGRVTSSAVKIETDQGMLSGLLYRPVDSGSEKFPAIVVAHGISESAQILSGFGLELSRVGFVVLCLDLPGHGGSDGSISQGQQDPALGIDVAVNYLSNLPYVDSTQIGLVAHSLGAGAVRAANTKLSNVQSSVLIGGGLGAAAIGEEYGSLNATFPKNVLLIVGEYDVLFNITQLITKDLLGFFGTSGVIRQDVLYGDFTAQTARKLVVPQTTHLFESLDPVAIQQTTVWMQQTLKTKQDYEIQFGLIYQYREIAQAVSVLALVGLILFAFYPVAALPKEKPKIQDQGVYGSHWKIRLVWFALNLILFFPLIAIGFVIGFPPLVFGSSIAWWLLLLALIGLAVFGMVHLRSIHRKVSIADTIRQNLPSARILVVGVILFLVLVAVTSCLQFLGLNLKIVAPIFQEFASIRRVLVFLAFLPFFLPFFFVQQLYLVSSDFLKSGKMDYVKAVLISVSPFILFLGVNFLPKVFFDFWVIPSFGGFLIEILWLLIPIFMLATFCSLYFFRQTGNLALGTIFNTLLLAWIAATVFPF